MTAALISWNVFLFVAAIAMLIFGSDWLVRASSRLARAMGVSPLVVGLTVVAFGTSAPEFAVCILAAVNGEGDIALGNVVGSNICNVLLILGLTALVLPLTIERQILRVDTPLMILGAMAMAWAASDGVLDWRDGLALSTGLLAYLAFVLWMAMTAKAPPPIVADSHEPERESSVGVLRDVAMNVVGLALLVGGGQALVSSSVAFARALGVDELVIGLTIVAIGTSMPEIATSLVAAWRGERDIAVGNVIGSNIFNQLGVLGATAMAARGGITVGESALTFDIPVMVAVAFLCLPIFYSRGEITRSEGALLLTSYVAYTLVLLLKATGSALYAPVGWGLLLGYVPLVLVFLAVSTGYEVTRSRRAA